MEYMLFILLNVWADAKGSNVIVICNSLEGGGSSRMAKITRAPNITNYIILGLFRPPLGREIFPDIAALNGKHCGAGKHAPTQVT